MPSTLGAAPSGDDVMPFHEYLAAVGENELARECAEMSAFKLRRAHLNQKIWGTTTFGITMSNHAHWYGPNARLRKWNRS